MITGNPVPLKVTEITPEVWIARDQVVSMEYEKGYYGYYGERKEGTTITLVNGRKIYVAGMRPIEIINILNKPRGQDGVGFDRGDRDELGDRLPDNAGSGVGVP